MEIETVSPVPWKLSALTASSWRAMQWEKLMRSMLGFISYDFSSSRMASRCAPRYGMPGGSMCEKMRIKVSRSRISPRSWGEE